MLKTLYSMPSVYIQVPLYVHLYVGHKVTRIMCVISTQYGYKHSFICDLVGCFVQYCRYLRLRAVQGCLGIKHADTKTHFYSK